MPHSLAMAARTAAHVPIRENGNYHSSVHFVTSQPNTRAPDAPYLHRLRFRSRCGGFQGKTLCNHSTEICPKVRGSYDVNRYEKLDTQSKQRINQLHVRGDNTQTHGMVHECEALKRFHVRPAIRRYHYNRHQHVSVSIVSSSNLYWQLPRELYCLSSCASCLPPTRIHKLQLSETRHKETTPSYLGSP